MASGASYDVAILGCGPVGAAAANLCAAAGLRTLVVERGTTPYLLPRAIHLDAEILRIFQSVGLADAVAAITRPLGGSIYLGCDGKPIRHFHAQDTRKALGWPGSNLFYQPHLEEVLRAPLTKNALVKMRLGHEVKSVHDDGSSVRVEMQSVEDNTVSVETARYVFACDGASSPTRKALGIALEDLNFEERWLVVDAFVRGPMRWPTNYEIPTEVRGGGYSLMVCNPARPATVLPGAGEHRRWEFMLLPSESDEQASQPGNIQRLLGEWVDPANVEVVRAAVYRFHGLIAHQWRKGNIFLMGDAAHQTPPFFGQGMCHGIRDAAQLTWKIAMVKSGLATDALLDTYQTEREGHVRKIITASIAAGAAVCILDPASAQERDQRFRAEEAARGGVTIAMTDVVPPITTGIVDTATGGERLPQPPITVHGIERRLDDILGGRFTVLGFDELPAGTSAAAWRAIGGQMARLARQGGTPTSGLIHDRDGAMEAWMTARHAEWVIVRPDRYVFGTAASPTALAALIAKLQGALHVAAQAEALPRHDSGRARA